MAITINHTIVIMKKIEKLDEDYFRLNKALVF